MSWEGNAKEVEFTKGLVICFHVGKFRQVKNARAKALKTDTDILLFQIRKIWCAGTCQPISRLWKLKLGKKWSCRVMKVFGRQL